jgi:DNA-binding response OmpR family regulator
MQGVPSCACQTTGIQPALRLNPKNCNYVKSVKMTDTTTSNPMPEIMMHASGQAVFSTALKILVVDDTPANLKLMQSALKMAGHTVITATSGEEALICFASEPVDVVLMDVRMPGIGGIEATRRLREMTGDRWVPILFISALSDSEDMVRGLEAGGDDYVPKPVDIRLLLAKIRALQRIAGLQEKLRRANDSLETYRQAAEQDMILASAVMDRMINSASMDVENVSLWLAPAAKLSGDLLVARKSVNGSVYILLGDAMGHGLPAAIPVMPLIHAFSAMANKGCSVSSIAREMNARLKTFLPTGNFVAVTLVNIDPVKQMIDIWNGGNPAPLLVDAEGRVIRRFASRQLALGILTDQEFDSTTESCQWTNASRFILYSDGLTEACNSRGEPFGEQPILAALAQHSAHATIKAALLSHLDGNAAGDDISLATVELQGQA